MTTVYLKDHDDDLAIAATLDGDKVIGFSAADTSNDAIRTIDLVRCTRMLLATQLRALAESLWAL